LIQKEVRQRMREEGRGKKEEGRGKQETRKRGRASRYLFPDRAREQGKSGNEAEPLDIYSQTEPGNKESGNEAEPLDIYSQGEPRNKETRDSVRAPSGLCLTRSDFNRLGNEAILLIFPAVGHCGACHTCSIDTSAIYISIAEVGIGKIGISQVGKSQVCTV